MQVCTSANNCFDFFFREIHFRDIFTAFITYYTAKLDFLIVLISWINPVFDPAFMLHLTRYQQVVSEFQSSFFFRTRPIAHSHLCPTNIQKLPSKVVYHPIYLMLLHLCSHPPTSAASPHPRTCWRYGPVAYCLIHLHMLTISLHLCATILQKYYENQSEGPRPSVPPPPSPISLVYLLICL